MGWNDRGGRLPASSQRVYDSRCSILRLALSHEMEATRLRGRWADDPEGAKVHQDRCDDLIRSIGLEHLQVKVDG